MTDGDLVQAVELRAIFPDGMSDRDAMFLVRAFEALVESVDPDGWVELLDRRELGPWKPLELEGDGPKNDAADDDPEPDEPEPEPKTYPCQYCGRQCASPGGRGVHEKACDENPKNARTPNEETFGTRDENLRDAKRLAS